MSEGDKSVPPTHPDEFVPHVGESPQPRLPKSFTQSKVLSLISARQPQVDGQGPCGDAGATQAPKTEGVMRQLSLPVAPSGLSVDAAEFVPMFKQMTQVPPHAGFPAVSSGLSADAPDFYYDRQERLYPYNSEQNVDYYLENDFGDLNLADPYESSDQPYYCPDYNSTVSVEERFDLALKFLIKNPSGVEDIEEYLKPICDDLSSMTANDRVVSNIVENLYQQCIQEDNVRYIGARICQYINSSLKMDPHFSKIFVNRCQGDFDRRDQLLHGSQDEKKRLQGLGMLLAEIFLNVETTLPDGSPQRLAFLPPKLISVVATLLSAPDDTNVKCGCNLLKLSGSLIEDVVKSNPETCVQFEGLFVSLQKLLKNSHMSENSRFHVEKVVSLKENGWDSPKPAAMSNMYNPYAQDQYYRGGAGEGFNGPDPDTVYYDQFEKEAEESGSHLLTEEEEADFLAWQSYQFDDYKQDPGMGCELEEAYEEFLKQQPPSYNYQPPAATPAPPAQPPVPPQDHYRYQGNPSPYSYYNHQDTHNHGQFQMQQYQHPQYNHHQQQAAYHYNHQQQQQPPQPRYPNQNPPQNDQYHYRR